jgi:hypothetical protein
MLLLLLLLPLPPWLLLLLLVRRRFGSSGFAARDLLSVRLEFLCAGPPKCL